MSKKPDPPKPTRREFLSTAGNTAAATLIAGYLPAHPSAVEQSNAGPNVGPPPQIEGAVPITLRINGLDRQLASTHEPHCSIAFAKLSSSPERRRAAITGNAAPAPFM